MPKPGLDSPCSIARTLAVVGERWTFLILRDAFIGVTRFADFRASMNASPVNGRWQSEMATLIDPLTDPATGFHQRLEEVFHLD